MESSKTKKYQHKKIDPWKYQAYEANKGYTWSQLNRHPKEDQTVSNTLGRLHPKEGDHLR